MDKVSQVCDLVGRPNVCGTVIVKNPSDFVGAVLGASEANTKAILDNAVGKVLVIDEVSRSVHSIWVTD